MMLVRKVSKIIITLIALSILAAIILLFWASSPNYSEEDYVLLIEDQFPQTVDQDSIYSIVSYNIGYLSGMTNNRAVEAPKALYDNNLNTVKEQIRNIDPDILCFQEIDYHSSRSFHVNQQEEIRQLGYNYTFQAANWDVNYLPFPGYDITYHYGEIYSGQSILSKYSITNPERIVLERVEDTPIYRDMFYIERLAQKCNIMLDGQEIVLINVHLEAYDKATRDKQTAYIVSLLQEYKDSKPVLLVGDFNSDPAYQSATINRLLEIPGIAYAKAPSEERMNTFPSTGPRVMIDYIFYNEAFIKIESAAVLTSFRDASDHLPVMMEFSLK